MTSLVSKILEKYRDPDSRIDPYDPRFTPDYRAATVEEVKSAEARLGFALPALLAELYQTVANGGFGPGIIGLPGGARSEHGDSIIDLYEILKQMHIDNPGWNWPYALLPLAEWGCNIRSCVDCTSEKNPVIRFDPNGIEHGSSWDRAFSVECSSLDLWFCHWLDGVNIFELGNGRA